VVGTQHLDIQLIYSSYAPVVSKMARGVDGIARYHEAVQTSVGVVISVVYMPSMLELCSSPERGQYRDRLSHCRLSQALFCRSNYNLCLSAVLTQKRLALAARSQSAFRNSPEEGRGAFQRKERRFFIRFSKNDEICRKTDIPPIDLNRVSRENCLLLKTFEMVSSGVAIAEAETFGQLAFIGSSCHLCSGRRLKKSQCTRSTIAHQRFWCCSRSARATYFKQVRH